MTNTLKKRPRPTEVKRRTPLVVCIDDDPHIAKALRLRLKAMDIDVLQATNGRDGLRLIKERKPDLVISDWWMDKGDGEYVLNKMQSDTETAQIPVIMVSGVGRPDFMNRMFAQGAKACYTKPIQFNALQEDLRTFLDIDDWSGMQDKSPLSIRLLRKEKQMLRRKRGRGLIRVDQPEESVAVHWNA
jgi:DNA-binding response OmpR family regulator